MRSALSIAVVALVLASGVASAPAAAATTAGEATSSDRPGTDDAAHALAAASGAVDVSNHDACDTLAGNSPADPETDRLGWENGCWYNESLSVTREDGLNETELDAVVARSMARVEAVRELEFERTVPVEIISRDTYRERRNDGGSGHTSTANRLHQNVKWEAMFSVGEDESALSTFSSTRSATVLGYYSFRDDRIVLVSENATTPKMDEITLSQELFHALQDQRLRISYDRSTREGVNARNGIVEGDGNLVDRRYQRRCESEWDCLMPASSGGASGGDDINFGIYLTQFQPYSDGPKFVRGIYSEGGWEAVNAVYENPPTSTEQVIHPGKYPDEGPADISFEDTSSEAWRIPDLGNGSVDYATFGQAGFAAMMMRPVFASRGASTPVVGPREFYNLTADGEISQFDPFNYGFDAVDGWGNDRLYPYVTEESAETNETGYVWKTVWDDEENASDFHDAYRQLIRYYGAEAVADRSNTYRIPDDREFGDAFWIERNGDTVVIVNAPSVEALSEVRQGAAPEVTPTATATAAPIETATDTAVPETDTATATRVPSETATPTPTDATAGNGPGFGGVAVVFALALAVLVARRRGES